MHLTDEEIILELSISRLTFLNFEQKKLLRKNIDSPYKLSLLSKDDIENFTEKKLSLRSEWNGAENFRMSKVAFQRCKMMNIQILLYDDLKYPELLRQTENPPYLLFYRGNVELLTNGKSVSVVGTRRITPEGRKSAHNFAYDAAVDGCNVVSGLANGVDGYAHQGAVDAWFDALEKGYDCNLLGKTIAVLPSAIDEITPVSHKKLASQILQTEGLILTEYEPGALMAKWHFVARNRIIAGLSPATVVIEAPAGSGALITADFALDENRDVLFHRAAFNSLAIQVGKVVHNDLEKLHANGRVSRYKMENCPEKFIEAGAPVINDYKDYCKCLAEMPGTRRNKTNLQKDLFSEDENLNVK